jgi:ribose 5-phosphate isomerase B
VSDHAAVEAKAALKKHLESEGHEVLDLGTEGSASVDYPDFAAKGGRAIAAGQAERGVFLCGTGIGVCIAANKIPGIRAATIHDANDAAMSRRHNDANVACFGGRTTAVEEIERLVDLWLATPFDGGRHVARVEKINALDAARTGSRPR